MQYFPLFLWWRGRSVRYSFLKLLLLYELNLFMLIFVCLFWDRVLCDPYGDLKLLCSNSPSTLVSQMLGIRMFSTVLGTYIKRFLHETGKLSLYYNSWNVNFRWFLEISVSYLSFYLGTSNNNYVCLCLNISSTFYTFYDRSFYNLLFFLSEELGIVFKVRDGLVIVVCQDFIFLKPKTLGFISNLFLMI